MRNENEKVKKHKTQEKISIGQFTTVQNNSLYFPQPDNESQFTNTLYDYDGYNQTLFQKTTFLSNRSNTIHAVGEFSAIDEIKK